MLNGRLASARIFRTAVLQCRSDRLLQHLCFNTEYCFSANDMAHSPPFYHISIPLIRKAPLLDSHSGRRLRANLAQANTPVFVARH